jgi:hypothetical protein
MTIQQDVQRAGLRALMADPKHGLPEYWADLKTVGRVGKVIGDTAGDEERHVRPSDSRGREDTSPDEHHSVGPNVWLWMVSCTLVCTTLGLGVLAYWRVA